MLYLAFTMNLLQSLQCTCPQRRVAFRWSLVVCLHVGRSLGDLRHSFGVMPHLQHVQNSPPRLPVLLVVVEEFPVEEDMFGC
jgi:hypothetical protein